jgi:uncharacterized membrane protein
MDAAAGTRAAPGVAAGPVAKTGRIDAVDLLRGVVMVLMAIDHVRVYAGVPAGGPTPGVFFTRWVTHFCAPAFVFFAGTGAFLHGRKLGDRGALARYLVTRGLLLVVLELTLIRSSWTFGVGGYGDFTLAGVIWMLGWCMVLLAALVALSPRTVGLLGVAIILLQQLFALVPRALPEAMRGAFGQLWEFVYPTGLQSFGGVAVLYVLVPWIGVMAAGYGFGTVLLREPADRRRFCLRVGLGATALFLLVAGGFASFGPAPDGAPPVWMRVLNQNKYPASQLFLLMTLGPTIALLPLAERARGRLADVFVTFGRVPMFYYLLHIPLIHASALLVGLIREGAVHPEWYATAPFASVPEEGRWSLGLLYLVFALDVAILYPLCRWYARLKSRSASRWLRYV